MKLSVISYFTKSYTYALKAQARRLVSNLAGYYDKFDINFIFATDKSPESAAAVDYFKELFGEKVKYHQIISEVDDSNFVAYAEDVQLLISQFLQAGLDRARVLGSDYCWILESYILPDTNTFRCLLDTLNYDGSFYDISFATYPSNGGGSFLGGFGDSRNHIYKDFLPRERKLSKEQINRLDKFDDEEKAFIKKKQPAPEEWVKTRMDFEKEIEKCPPNGNIWDLLAKNGWRPRGWLDFAAPALSRGTTLRVNWIGTGCALLSRKALSVAFLDGYRGQGTQDLYLCYERWLPAGLRIAVVTNCLCDHVIRLKDKDGKRGSKIVLLQSFWEPSGDAKDHLRWKAVPWYSSELGEKWDVTNDGKLS